VVTDRVEQAKVGPLYVICATFTKRLLETEWWIPVHALCERANGDDLLVRCRAELSDDVQKMLGVVGSRKRRNWFATKVPSTLLWSAGGSDRREEGGATPRKTLLEGALRMEFGLATLMAACRGE